MELLAQGITYVPFVWSSYGAPDPAVTQALTLAASRAHQASRAGPPRATLRRWLARVSVAIWRRNARMAQTCIRPLADPELYSETLRGCESDECSDALYGGDPLEEPA